MDNTREKLIELLITADDYEDCVCLGNLCKDCRYQGENCTYVAKADYLIANGVAVQEWISTDERMPTEGDATDGYVAVVYAWGDGVKTKTISLVDVVIAHPDLYDYWMPLNLPQPPKGE